MDTKKHNIVNTRKQDRKVKNGDWVTVEFTGKFQNGFVFDSSDKLGMPLTFKTGNRKVIPGFEEAIIGMGINEEKEVKIPPNKAFGEYDKELVRAVPMSQFQTPPKAGMVIAITDSKSRKIPAKIVQVEATKAIVDFNHIFAGQTLVYNLKIIDIGTAVKEI